MNEQVDQNDEPHSESVADLEVSPEQADDIQAGTSSAYPDFRGGIYVASSD